MVHDNPDSITAGNIRNLVYSEAEDVGLNRRRLRQYRLRARLTQQVLGEATGMTQPYISDLERGIRRHIRPARLAALAHALGVPMERLVRTRRHASTTPP